MTKPFVLAIFILLSIQAQAEVNVQSYVAWKTARVEDARATLERLQSERNVQSVSGKAPEKKLNEGKPEVTSRLQPSVKAGRSDQKMQQAQLNLEVAQELTVNDYFVLYLSQFKSRDAFLDAAKKLNPDEAADLMLAYQKHLTASAPAYDEVAPATTNISATPAPPIKSN